MDAELKALLQQIASKLEGFDKRLTALEATAHKQVTMADVMKRATQVVRAGGVRPYRDVKLC